jgi:hypothetical protein
LFEYCGQQDVVFKVWFLNVNERGFKMKHNISKLIWVCLTIFASFSARAQLEKNEVYLFTCAIADNPVYQQLAFKYVTVLEQGGQYQYFVMDVEAGNQTQDIHGEGHHLKYVQTLFTTQNADTDRFVMLNRNDYLIEAQYSGSASRSTLSVDMLMLNNGAFELNLDGFGPLYNQLISEFETVMADSNLYNRFDKPICLSHPNLRNFLD